MGVDKGGAKRLTFQDAGGIFLEITEVLRLPEEARHLWLTLLPQRTKKLGWMIGYQPWIELLFGMGGQRRSDLYSWQGIYGGRALQEWGLLCSEGTRPPSL